MADNTLARNLHKFLARMSPVLGNTNFLVNMLLTVKMIIRLNISALVVCCQAVNMIISAFQTSPSMLHEGHWLVCVTNYISSLMPEYIYLGAVKLTKVTKHANSLNVFGPVTVHSVMLYILLYKLGPLLGSFVLLASSNNRPFAFVIKTCFEAHA